MLVTPRPAVSCSPSWTTPSATPGTDSSSIEARATSTSSSKRPMPASLPLGKPCAQRGQPPLPLRADPLDPVERLAHRLGRQPVARLPPEPLPLDEARVAERGEMLRDRLPRHREL